MTNPTTPVAYKVSATPHFHYYAPQELRSNAYLHRPRGAALYTPHSSSLQIREMITQQTRTGKTTQKLLGRT